MKFVLLSVNRLRRIASRHLLADLFVMLTSSALTATLLAPQFGVQNWSEPVGVYGGIGAIVFLVTAFRVAFMITFGCYSVMWRYITTSDALHLAKAVAVASAVGYGTGLLVIADLSVWIPPAFFLIDTMLALSLLMGTRLYRRILYEGQAGRQSQRGRRTLIYGAGQNGRLLAQRFRQDAYLDTNVVGFIDDSSTKADLMIHSLPVLGTRKDLAQVIEKFKITQVFVAIPDLSGSVLRELVIATRPFNIKPRVLSSSGDRHRTAVDIDREIELPDLLNRTPIKVDLAPVAEMIHGRCVLITGAGGSIGSELARQIAVHEPRKLLLLDSSEFNLYEIDRELRLATADIQRVVPLLVDLKDEASLRQVMNQYRPEVIMHAAAYKHVHLVEANPHSSILNNVEGTQNLLQLADEVKTDVFLMISTDKAVNPVGVMGATKRVCELLVTARGLATGRRYSSVRFGNVLGSSGSLIPLLKQQILDGGPVTVTHPDMMRFFMLIPEAVSLVLKAATMAKPGDINVLKMGEPVRILDIARSLIALLGRSETEVPIVFTGLRPGEKMFEELYLSGNEIQTEHPDILTLPNGDAFPGIGGVAGSGGALFAAVELMLESTRIGSPRAVQQLSELVQSSYFGAITEGRDDGSIHFHH